MGVYARADERLRRRAGNAAPMMALAGVIALCATGILMLPLLLQPGLAPGNDTAIHVGNVVESAHLLAHGLPPWDWLPDIAGGYGGPNYVYYGHLGFVFPAFLVNSGVPPVAALRIAVAIAFAVAAVTSYFFCASVGGRFGGLAGAVLFVSGPYFLGLSYVRGSYPEFFAYALYPLALLLARRWVERGAFRDWIGTSLALSAVIAIHTLSVVLLAPLLVIYCGGAGVGGGRWRVAPRMLALLGVTFLLSALFLVGPFLETHKVEISRQFATADVYKTGGVPWHAMFNRDPLAGHVVSYALPGRGHLIACGIAVAAALSAASARLRRSLLGHLGLAVAALFLVEETVARLSVQAAPPLRYLQFPWRWLGVFNLFACSALAGVFHQESPIPPKARPLIACGFPLLCLWLYAGMIPPQEATRFRTETREGIRRSLTTLDHEDKYMPVGARLPEAPAPAVLVEAPEGSVALLREGLNDSLYAVRMPQAATAWFHQHHFDGWRAEIDGVEAPLRQGGELGICLLDFPAGEHVVRVWFARTPLRSAAAGISIATAAALLVLSLVRVSTALCRWRAARRSPAS